MVHEDMDEFYNITVPKLERLGMAAKAKAGNECCLVAMRYYGMLLDEFDPQVHDSLKESIKQYEASLARTD